MKKLLIALTAAASAFGLYADVAIGGAGFDSVDAAPLTWTATNGFDADYWSGTDGTMTLVTPDDSGKLAADRPAGYSVTDRDGYMALKTTLGTPVFQNVKTSGAVQTIDPNFFYDGLVQFTAFDETPDLAAYTDAKIGIFPMLENPDSETAYLWVYANGGTNLWKTTTEIDGAWHRVTIKMIKNVTRTASATEVGFVVFVDGMAVNCMDAQAAFDGIDLNPAAKAYFDEGKLFRSLAPEANEFTGVAYDGQGLLDEVGFTDLEGAPEFALDENWKSLAWNGSTIAEVYLWEKDGDNDAVQIDTLTASPADFVAASGKTYYYSYKAASSGYMDQTELVKIEGAQVTITDPKTCAAKVNGVGYETIGAALDVIYDATEAQELVLCADVEESISIDTMASVVLDLAGFNITAGAGEENAIYSNCELTIKDTTENSGVISGGTSEAIYVGYSLTIEGGIIDGYVNENAGQGEKLEYTLFKGGKVSVDENVTADGECTIPTESGYIAKEVTGYWEVVADTRFTVTVVAAVENSTIASIVVDDVAVKTPAAGEFLAETSVVVTYAPDYGYKFTDPTLAEQTLTKAGSTTAPAVEALTIVAYIGSAPYYTFADAFAAAKATETITIVEDCSFDAQITIDRAITITINEGKTLSWTGDKSTYPLYIAADVTINGAGTLLKETESATLVTVNAGAKLTLDGATLKTIASNVIKNLGTFEMKSGLVDGVQRGVKVEGTSAAATFIGGKVKGGTAGTTGGGDKSPIVLDGAQASQVTIASDSTIKLNVAQNDFAPAGYKFLEDSEDEGWFKLFAAKTINVKAGEGIATVKSGDVDVTGDVTIKETDVPFTVTLTAADGIESPVFKIAVNGDDPVAVESPFTFSDYAQIVEGALVVFTAEAGAAPIIDPTDPESKQTIEATDADDAIAKAEVGVPEAAKGIVEPADYKAYFNFKATPAGEGKFEVEIAGLKADVVEAPTTADLVANFDEIGEDGLTVVAKPGLFYGVKQAAAVDGVAAAAIETEGTGLATSTEVKLPVIKQGDAGFYKVVVDVKPFEK